MKYEGLLLLIVIVTLVVLYIMYKPTNTTVSMENFDDTTNDTHNDTSIEDVAFNLVKSSTNDTNSNTTDMNTNSTSEKDWTKIPPTDIKTTDMSSVTKSDMSNITSVVQLVEKVNTLNNTVNSLNEQLKKLEQEKKEYDEREKQYQKVITTYGYSFVDPDKWTVPQQHPPVCIANQPSNVDPLVADTYPNNVMVFADTTIGSKLPPWIFANLTEPKWRDPEFLKTLTEEEKKIVFPNNITTK
jgi:hypothetical protein